MHKYELHLSAGSQFYDCCKQIYHSFIDMSLIYTAKINVFQIFIHTEKMNTWIAKMNTVFS